MVSYRLTYHVILDEDVWFSYRQMTNTIAVQCLHSIFPHQSADAMFATRLSEFTKILQDPRSAIDAVTHSKRGASESQKPSIFLRSVGYRLSEPGVIPCSGDAEKPAYHRNAELTTMRLNEFVSSLRLAQHVSRGHGAFPHLQTQMLDLSTKSWNSSNET
jgi:hypothetical protein